MVVVVVVTGVWKRRRRGRRHPGGRGAAFAAKNRGSRSRGLWRRGRPDVLRDFPVGPHGRSNKYGDARFVFFFWTCCKNR